jgi:hypothetical protein
MPAVPWNCRIRRTRILLLFSSNLERFARLYSLRRHTRVNKRHARWSRGDSDAWSNFSSNRSLTPDAPFSVRMRPGHSSRSEPNQPAQRQQKFRSDRFACFERSSFCWKPVLLGSRALGILIALLERHGELVSKQDLMARVWPDVFVALLGVTEIVFRLHRASASPRLTPPRLRPRSSGSACPRSYLPRSCAPPCRRSA